MFYILRNLFLHALLKNHEQNSFLEEIFQMWNFYIFSDGFLRLAFVWHLYTEQCILYTIPYIKQRNFLWTALSQQERKLQSMKYL